MYVSNYCTLFQLSVMILEKLSSDITATSGLESGAADNLAKGTGAGVFGEIPVLYHLNSKGLANRSYHSYRFPNLYERDSEGVDMLYVALIAADKGTSQRYYLRDHVFQHDSHTALLSSLNLEDAM